jgi:hypothetical protein
MVSDQQFYRLNRQYLINFSAVKEAGALFRKKATVIPPAPLTNCLYQKKKPEWFWTGLKTGNRLNNVK